MTALLFDAPICDAQAPTLAVDKSPPAVGECARSSSTDEAGCTLDEGTRRSTDGAMVVER